MHKQDKCCKHRRRRHITYKPYLVESCVILNGVATKFLLSTIFLWFCLVKFRVKLPSLNSTGKEMCVKLATLFCAGSKHQKSSPVVSCAVVHVQFIGHLHNIYIYVIGEKAFRQNSIKAVHQGSSSSSPTCGSATKLKFPWDSRTVSMLVTTGQHCMIH